MDCGFLQRRPGHRANHLLAALCAVLGPQAPRPHQRALLVSLLLTAAPQSEPPYAMCACERLLQCACCCSGSSVWLHASVHVPRQAKEYSCSRLHGPDRQLAASCDLAAGPTTCCKHALPSVRCSTMEHLSWCCELSMSTDCSDLLQGVLGVHRPGCSRHHRRLHRRHA